MTRLGWTLLALFLLAGAAFASMLSFGGSRPLAPVARPVAAPVVTASGLAVPVAGVGRAALADSWGQERGGGLRSHHAIDIMAPRGTPVLAAADGRVEKLFTSIAGGRTAYLRSADGRTVYYYAHLDAYARGLAEGQVIRRGRPLATVGSTGSASEDAPHLHFEVKRMAPGERWWQGREVNPYPLLAGSGPDR
jgi:peptidoglycan LD-endopeptidase LytH